MQILGKYHGTLLQHQNHNIEILSFSLFFFVKLSVCEIDGTSSANCDISNQVTGDDVP